MEFIQSSPSAIAVAGNAKRISQMSTSESNRRDFLKGAGALGASLSAAGSAFAKAANKQSGV
ncbi:MAG TPA: hypothetical protein DEH78_04785, partial [Solibacterales bacterium]|nr:hypothetical protein [Bryobacterales bacterium]